MNGMSIRLMKFSGLKPIVRKIFFRGLREYYHLDGHHSYLCENVRLRGVRENVGEASR